jgi:hypothetical protein
VVIETDLRNVGSTVEVGAQRGVLICTDSRRYGDTVLLFWDVALHEA